MSSPDANEARRPILVFDGACVLCSETVRWVLRHERDEAVVFAAAQSDSGALLLRRAGLDPAAPATFLFVENDRLLTRSDAALALAARLRAPWRWLEGFRFIPKPLRDWVYDWIARNRFSWFGRRDICLRPELTHERRFLL